MQKRWRAFYKRCFRRQDIEPLALTQPAIEQWFTGNSGRYLLAKERELVKQLPPLPGYHLMELGVSAKFGLADDFANLHCFQLAPAQSKQAGFQAVSEFDALPLPADIIDVAVLHHSLEFSQQPHAVLSEVSRVVAPSGHVVIFVFNPFCLLGLSKWLRWVSRKPAIWRQHSLPLGRVMDWLRVLDFKAVSVNRGGFGVIKESNLKLGIFKKMAYGIGLPTGMFYTIVAQKQVANHLFDNQVRWRPKPMSEFGWNPIGGQAADNLHRDGSGCDLNLVENTQRK